MPYEHPLPPFRGYPSAPFSGTLLTSVEGLGNVDPRALDELSVPHGSELASEHWMSIGLTHAVAAAGGGVAGKLFAGKFFAGAATGLGGAAIATALLPPVWIKVERARCYSGPNDPNPRDVPAVVEYVRPSTAARLLLGIGGALATGLGLYLSLATK